ncbi:hypothetical protein ACT3CE_10445 [Marinifilum sp. RC60d5]|uniref:hypothetical protein n=1 Tax=Marinifilum sp. RC60d5 TaxID=3458414 RepID=UPI004035717B
MKRILFAILICAVSGITAFAQKGELMSATHNIYTGIAHTYKVTGDDDISWEVFSNEDCTSTADAAAYTFTGTTNLTKELTLTWNVAGTYYLRVKQLNTTTSCYNYKTLKVVVTAVDDMTFAFAASATSEDCAVNISGADISFDVTLSGLNLVHVSGKQAQIEYDVDGGTKDWLNVSLAEGSVPGTYYITIPAAQLVSTTPEATQSFAINVYQLKDGNGATNDFTATPVTHTWIATGLPTISDIEF